MLGEVSHKDDGSDKPRVVHVSGDFPDCFEPAKTRVIQSLVTLTADRFDHHVISINRVMPGLASALGGLTNGGDVVVDSQPFEYGMAVRYAAPPKGIFHARYLRQLGEWLAQSLARDARKPDLLVAHKLGIEGIAVRHAARLLEIPYALSIQGDTDTKIIATRPDLAGAFNDILSEAKLIFPFAPWAWNWIEDRLGSQSTPHVMLPCPTEIDTPLEPKLSGSGFATIFHLQSYRRKNLNKLAKAVRLLEVGSDPVSLTVYGGGSPTDRAKCEAIIAQSKAVKLGGPLQRDEIRAALNSATGFVLPSLRETFGLVFIEALFAGTPIIYPRGTAVDGYFASAPFAVPVDARNPRSIADAIIHVQRNENELKQELARWQASDHARSFQRPAIGQAFVKGLEAALD